MELQKLIALVDLLMAAASQDGHVDEEEFAVIQGYLEEMGLVDEEDRSDLDEHMSEFDIDEFDLEGTLAELGELDDDERAAVIALLEMVEEADGVIDLGESDFIAQVALALGASQDEVDQLSVEILDDDLPEPPPLPATDLDPELGDEFGDEEEEGDEEEDE